LRFTFVAAVYHPSTPHSSGFARLASGAFYAAIALATFYEIIDFDIKPSPFREWRQKALTPRLPEKGRKKKGF